MNTKEQSLGEFGVQAMTLYGTEVNLDRSVPELYDGMKPIYRRIAWSAHHYPAHELVKSAKVVGTCIGTYSPHGDAGTYGAMVTMVHHNVPVIDGVGNWGNIIDPPAAHRYTNCRLSKVGVDVMEPDYLAVTSMVPNYDDTTVEPVVLPVRLPFLILNGAEGIGVGITTSVPTFTLDSTLEVLTRLLKGEELSAVDYARTLKPMQHYGGHLVKTKENAQQWLTLMKTGDAKVQFESSLELDEAKRTVTISEWPAGLNPQRFVEKVRALPECQRAYNSKGSLTFKVEIKKGHDFQETVNKIRKLTVSAENYKFNVTHRTAKTEDGITTYNTKFLHLSVIDFFKTWLVLRLKLEKKCLEYKMACTQKAIDYSNLLVYACSKLDVIFKALKSTDPIKYMTSHMKVSEEQAKAILELKVRQLSSLDRQELLEKLKRQQEQLKQLQHHYKHPKEKICSEFGALRLLVEEDAKLRAKQNNQKLVVH